MSLVPSAHSTASIPPGPHHVSVFVNPQPDGVVLTPVYPEDSPLMGVSVTLTEDGSSATVDWSQSKTPELSVQFFDRG